MPAHDDPTAGSVPWTATPSGQDLRLLAMRWDRAEASLFALAVADTELFELAVNASVAVRDELRVRCRTIDALIDVSVDDLAERTPLLRQSAIQGLDAQLVVDAARAQRRRELQAAPGIESE